jgi:glycogen synthase
MRIVVASYAYAPAVGGIETAGRLLVAEFRARGHEVTVLTNTRVGDRPEELGVLRLPEKSVVENVCREADIILLNNISLRYFFPAYASRKPLVVTTHTWIRRPSGKRSLIDYLKLCCLKVAHARVAVSAAISKSLPRPAEVIAPPYDEDIFVEPEQSSSRREIIFAGRLVSDKGCDLLLQAVHLLGQRYHLHPRLLVVGEGPQSSALMRMRDDLGLAEQVVFTAAKDPRELAAAYQEHQVVVMPSRWDEPFGLVVVEAIACGCVAIGSSGGGLPEAIGPAGVTFPNGNLDALVERLAELLRTPEAGLRYRAAAAQHVMQFTKKTVADRYLALFAGLVSRRI